MYFTLEDVEQVDIRLSNPGEKHYEAFDFTKFDAIATCPTWGIIRYGHWRRFDPVGRSLALEAGSAGHDFFAACRLVDLWNRGYHDHFYHHGARIYGEERFESFSGHLTGTSGREDSETAALRFCLGALDSCGFENSEYDNRRTVENLEEACIAYFDRWPFDKHQVWIEDDNDPTARVGIETPFSLLVSFHLRGGADFTFRFIGKCDGIVHSKTQEGHVVIQENKTASKPDSVWESGMEVSYQVTGYAMGAQLVSGMPCDTAIVIGMAIPQPKKASYDGIVSVTCPRSVDYHYSKWLDWMLHQYQVYQQHRHDPLNAPQFRHSCNRYFSNCHLIPLCSEQLEHEREALWDGMVVDSWHPLEGE